MMTARLEGILGPYQSQIEIEGVESVGCQLQVGFGLKCVF